MLPDKEIDFTDLNFNPCRRSPDESSAVGVVRVTPGRELHVGVSTQGALGQVAFISRTLTPGPLTVISLPFGPVKLSNTVRISLSCVYLSPVIVVLMTMSVCAWYESILPAS